MPCCTERTRRRLDRTEREYLVVWNDGPFRRSSRQDNDVFLFEHAEVYCCYKRRTVSRSLERTVRLAVQEQQGGLRGRDGTRLDGTGRSCLVSCTWRDCLNRLRRRDGRSVRSKTTKLPCCSQRTGGPSSRDTTRRS